MYCLLIALLITIINYTTSQSQYNHASSSKVNTSWMGLLDNGIPIRQMSIIGTHSSMSTGTWGDAFQTQSNSLMGQMVMGMRALDICCNHKNNALPVNDRFVYLNTDLGGVLTTVRSFLQTNPSETILMHIVQQSSASGNSETFQQSFIRYKNNFLDIVWIPTSQDPVLGEVRGKVVIIQDFTGLTIHGLLYSTFTVLPHYWMNTNWNLYDKWTLVKNFLGTANAAGASQLSFWTGHGGSFPYFVASGKSSPGNGAPRLVTGATTPGWPSSYCSDFPRVACFIGICSIVFEGINILGYNYIVNQNYKYLGIIFTDFAGDQLITKVIGVNTGKFAACPASLLTQGCTYCSATGLCLGCNTTMNYLYTPNTCSAKSGYYLNWINATYNSVVACNIPMIGCLTCSSATICTLCDTFSNYRLANDSCQAAPGFYLDNSSIPVKCTLKGCYQCISNTVCGVCSSVNNYILDTTTNTCVCDSAQLFTQSSIADACVCIQGYYLASNATCQSIPLCPSNGSGCINCSLGPPCSCTLCDTANYFQTYPLDTAYCSCLTGYYFDGSACLACNSTLLNPACTSCASSLVCLTCVNNFTLFNGNCICLPQYYAFDSDTCYACPIGCLQCNSSSVCLICDTANNFTMFSTICLCNNGLFLSGLSCVPCASMPGCLTCNTVGCTSCDSIFGFNFNSSTSSCQCSSGNYISSMNVCAPCTQLGCLQCTSLSVCTNCNTSNFYLSNQVCDQICGDGILYVLPCDDGNTVSGDGCSSNCSIETNWTCVPGSVSSPSLCSYSGPLTISVVSVIKDPSANKVYFKATLEPALASLATLDFNSVLSADFPIQSNSILFDSSSGNISIVFDYNQSLNNQLMSYTFSPPATPAFHFMNKTSVKLPQHTDNNLALKVYDSQLYSLAPLIDTLVQALAISVVATFLICFLFISKLIAVQMILIYQLTYTALIMILKLQLLMVPLRNLWIVNGYNQLFQDTASKNLPGRVSEIYYKASFLSNFSIDAVLFIIPALIGIGYIIYGKFSSKQTRLQGYRIMKEWIFSVLLFLQMHLNISTILQFDFGTNKMIGIAIGAVIQMLLIAELILYLVRPKNFGQYVQFFQAGKLSQKWYIIVFLFRSSLAIIIGSFGGNSSALYAALGLTAFFTIFGIIIRPYLSNVRQIINNLFLILILGVYAYAKINQNSQDATFSTSYQSIFLIAILFLALIFNILCMIVYKVSQCKQDNKKTAVNQVFKDNQHESKEIGSLYINQIKQQLKDSLIKTNQTPKSQHQKISERLHVKDQIIRLDYDDSYRQRMNSQTQQVLDNQAL